ncbi:MAG TPA: ABC transporter permease [Candidatus Berkiella sp.]|nr:ABC transporter permease [Candidatus Berkiella sp.]
MNIVMLASDYLIFLLVIIGGILLIRAHQQKQLFGFIRQIFYRPLNLVAGIILISYILVGLLDSIHYRPKQSEGTHNGSIISVLDKILKPISMQSERSFSAPFAIFAFTKETIKHSSGEVSRDYPRLTYAGAHLRDKTYHLSDIRQRLINTVVKSAIIWMALSILLLLYASAKHGISFEKMVFAVIKGKTLFPWRTLLLTIGLLSFLLIAIYSLIPYYHILGTNQVGEDVLYQSLKSIRTGLIIGTITTLVMLPFAILFGIMAGYFRGWVDDVIQYVYTTLSSIPGVLLIAAAVLTLQLVMDRHSDWFATAMQRSDIRLLALCAILGITSWTGLCRLLRGETLKISEMDYVKAAHSLGVKDFKIIFKHFLPNVVHIILITLTLDFSGLVLAEAVLSYVGVGVDPASYSWGTMINSARLEMARVPIVWWSLTAAFVFMFTLVLAANIFSDAVRDAFDPHSELRGAR